MSRKIIGMCVCMLVIATALPTVGIMNNNIKKNIAPLQPPGIEWIKTYGGEEFNWLYDIESSSDGGYIAGGVFEYQNRMCAWMLKTDENGNEQWSAINDLWYGLSPIEYQIAVQNVIEVEDGFIAGGYGIYNDDPDVVVGQIWKVNMTGKTQWWKVLGNETESWSVAPFEMVRVGDEIVCGGLFWQTTTPPDYIQDAALFKIDLDGNLDLSWINTYDAGGDEWARSLWKTTDGGYFLAGSTEEPNPNVENGSYFIVKTDSNGVKEWSKTFDGIGEDYSAVRGCRQTDDGGYITCGLTTSWNHGYQDIWIVKTNASGDLEWDRIYKGEYNDHIYGMDAADLGPNVTDDGYIFVIVKNAWKPTEPKEDLWIIETDKNGNPEYELLVEEEGTQWLQGIDQIDDKGFIVVGRTGVLTSTDCSGMIMEIAPFPHFEIEINGGIGVNAVITNNGYGDAIDVPYEINVKGGLFGMINKTKVGLLDIPVEESKTVSTGLFFGFGKISITVKIGVKEKSSEGKIFLIRTRIIGD